MAKSKKVRRKVQPLALITLKLGSVNDQLPLCLPGKQFQYTFNGRKPFWMLGIE